MNYDVQHRRQFVSSSFLYKNLDLAEIRCHIFEFSTVSGRKLTSVYP